MLNKIGIHVYWRHRKDRDNRLDVDTRSARSRPREQTHFYAEGGGGVAYGIVQAINLSQRRGRRVDQLGKSILPIPDISLQPLIGEFDSWLIRLPSRNGTRRLWLPTEPGETPMKSTTLVAAAVATVLASSPIFAPTASAQPAPPGGSSPSYVVPLVVGAAAGATVGALLWPAMVPAAGAAVVAPAAASGWGWGAFFTTRAAVGAVIGGGLGYLAAR